MILGYLRSVVSSASCSKYCLAPSALVVHDKFGVVEWLMTTAQAMAADEVSTDGRSRSYNRCRQGCREGDFLLERQVDQHGVFRESTRDVSVVDLTVCEGGRGRDL